MRICTYYVRAYTHMHAVCTYTLLGSRRTSLKTKPTAAPQPTPSVSQTATTTAAAPVSGGINTNMAIQLQQSKQRLQQLHQQLLMGNQHLKELQKHPNQEQNIAQLQAKLKLGVQQYQQLQQGIQQMTAQLQQQQQQQPVATTQPPTAVQVKILLLLCVRANVHACACVHEAA